MNTTFNAELAEHAEQHFCVHLRPEEIDSFRGFCGFCVDRFEL